MTPFVLVEYLLQHKVMIFYTEIHLLPKSGFHVDFPAQKELH